MTKQNIEISFIIMNRVFVYPPGHDRIGKIRPTADTMHENNDHLLKSGAWWVTLKSPDLLFVIASIRQISVDINYPYLFLVSPLSKPVAISLREIDCLIPLGDRAVATRMVSNMYGT